MSSQVATLRGLESSRIFSTESAFRFLIETRPMALSSYERLSRQRFIQFAFRRARHTATLRSIDWMGHSNAKQRIARFSLVNPICGARSTNTSTIFTAKETTRGSTTKSSNRAAESATQMKICRHERLGGMLHYHYRECAKSKN